ncbi:hypothetical protein RDI58_003695 [Solanum bulbocastanum]|uniref:PROP1-like PPR domain-containing protein n=1 Tax=Solanum bulbocastanum TaxID=147425 RepID=A0AAN8UFP0_SOLBU
MDSIFSPKPHTLSLLSCSPISSSLVPRRQVLSGSTHSLRPPGLHSRRRCRNIGFQFGGNTSRFVLRASLDSQTVVFASVVTISALTVVFLEFSKRNTNANAKFKEISAELTLALRRQIRHVMNWFPRHVFTLINIQEEKSVKTQMKEVTKVSNEREDGGTDVLQHDGTYLIQTFVTNNIESLDTNQLAPSSNGSSTLGASVPNAYTESDAVPSSFVAELNNIYLQENLRTTKMSNILTTEEVREPEPIAHTESDAVPSSFVEESKNIYLQEHLHETKTSNILTTEEVSSERSALFPAINIDNRPEKTKKMDQELMTKDGRKKAHKFVAEDEVIIHNLIFRDSTREDLYSFFEASSKSLNGQDALTSHASLQGIGTFSPPSKVFSVRAEDFEEKRSHGCYKEGPFNKKDFLKRMQHFTNKEKSILPDNGASKQLQIPNPKGIQVCDRPNPSDQFRDYRHFLRDGRLMDCIEILEDMERHGSLNMDKVYHAGFFQVCKSQKAVKEAFRFTKLIRNPTLSTFNMLLSVCASSRDLERAFQVLQLVRETGLKPDCKLYTTLISTCAKAGKVDTMFEVFHEMVNAGVEPNANTYGTLIDGCAKAGQVAKAFGAYGIMRSKNVKPDRVVFNALITACGQSGAVDRAFDVLSEMKAEARPIEPDQITIGALMKACANAGQADRALEVYRMIDKCDIKGTPEVYTIAVNCCSQNGNWEFARSIYDDMSKKGVNPDEMFISALIDVAGHTGKLEAAFEVLEEARTKGINLGSISYSSLMGACCNAKNWQKALELYEDIKGINLKPTVSMMNALITALCYADQYQKALEIFSEMKKVDLCPNTITYSTLLVASEKKDDLDVGLMLLSHAKKDGVAPNLVMCRCLLAMCSRRFHKACTLGEPVLSNNSGRLQLDSKWTSLALMVYRETIGAGVVPTIEELSLVLGCLQLPCDASLKERLIENLGLTVETSKGSNLCSLIDGFGEYDPRACSLLEEAASLGIVPLTSFKGSPIVVDVRNLHIHAAQVYLLTVLKSLKHRLAAGAKIPNISILLPVEQSHIQTPTGEKTIKIAGRINRAVAALLRRLGLPYQGNESFGKIRINGVIVKRWFQPKLESPFSWEQTGFSFSQTRLRKGISHQQRTIRTGDLSLD